MKHPHKKTFSNFVKSLLSSVYSKFVNKKRSFIKCSGWSHFVELQNRWGKWTNFLW